MATAESVINALMEQHQALKKSCTIAENEWAQRGRAELDDKLLIIIIQYFIFHDGLVRLLLRTILRFVEKR
ncbi:hypothetical protein A359_02610 [secondary endosymbiont of Ctenarytaina eucalypti]|uniref:Uncharacterized protein n=1 Tax=secondary endosymbiont of Ctenarytaina eucalypti TaxID=1199245 RepID=J3TF39_9ENTR|nr:hypothetical protein A359_02610 [secondary endosymbiont of Ctenarytaina eucalypti]